MKPAYFFFYQLAETTDFTHKILKEKKKRWSKHNSQY